MVSPGAEIEIRQPAWVLFLGWMEIIAGVTGLLVNLMVSLGNPTFLPVWHQLLSLLFFGANLVAGILLIQGHEKGIALSFLVQLLQVVFWNSGIAWVARAGLHVTPVIASTGFGVFFGPSAEFFSYPVETTSMTPGPALNIMFKVGFFWKAISEASFACGVNLVALFFTLRLWKRLSVEADPAQPVAPRPGHPIARWSLPFSVAAVALAALYVAFGGPTSSSRPMARILNSKGDTLDILWLGTWYEAGVRLTDNSLNAQRFYLVRFRSDFHDPDRDHLNAIEIAQRSCRYADSLGLKRMSVRPTSGKLVTTSRSYWFDVDTAAHCPEGR